MKKRTLIITAALCVSILSATVVIAAPIIRQNLSVTGQAPAYYLDREENLASVTAVVGDRAYVRLDRAIAQGLSAGQTENSTEEAASAEFTETELSSELFSENEISSSDSSENEISSAESSDASTPGASSSGPVYMYYPLGQVDDDVTQYISYLTSEKSFLNITDIDSSLLSQEPETAPAENTSVSREDTPSADQPEQIYRFAGPSQNTSDYLLVTIETFTDRYIIIPRTESGPWNAFVSRLWESTAEQPQKQAESTSYQSDAQLQAVDPQPSLSLAEQIVSQTDSETLGLSGPLDQYTFIADRGLVQLNTREFYQINTYLRNTSGTLNYVCTFLVDSASEKIVYRYDTSPDQLVALGDT